MIKFLQLPVERRLEIIEQAAAKTGLTSNAVEKDWWVTLALNVSFNTKWKGGLLFKGGTSLSKSWALIKRFSEDIDLVINREVLGFKGVLTKSQVSKLRKVTSKFIATDFLQELQSTLLKMGVDPALFTIVVEKTDLSDRDPQLLELHYTSLFEPDNYLAEKILIEIGARSLLEPAEERAIHSIIGDTFPEQPYSGSPFMVMTVNPQRTFLEKLFLLHEEFAKVPEKIRYERMSRHLYDVEHLMDTEYGKAALSNVDLYKLIVRHREHYTPVRGLDYVTLSPPTLSFIPPATVIDLWEVDYKSMQASMIYGESLPFAKLMERLNELQSRVRQIPW